MFFSNGASLELGLDGEVHLEESESAHTVHEELSKYHALAVQRLTGRGHAAFFGSQVRGLKLRQLH